MYLALEFLNVFFKLYLIEKFIQKQYHMKREIFSQREKRLGSRLNRIQG
jgi:hypothetical protein